MKMISKIEVVVTRPSLEDRRRGRLERDQVKQGLRMERQEVRQDHQGSGTRC